MHIACTRVVAQSLPVVQHLILIGSGQSLHIGKAVYEALKERGVLVRYFGKPRLANWLRISIGTPEEMAVLIRELKDILGKA